MYGLTWTVYICIVQFFDICAYHLIIVHIIFYGWIITADVTVVSL